MRASLFAFLLLGCSDTGAGVALEEFDAHLHPKCGWVENVNPVVVPACAVWTTTDGCGNLPDYLTPCDSPPVLVLEVEANQHHTEWFKPPIRCQFGWKYCPG